MKKEITLKINTITKFILIISIFIFMFFVYTNFYYGNISIKTLQTHLIVCSNISIKFVYRCLNAVITSVLTEANVKVLIISIVSIFIIHKFDLKKLLSRITLFQMGDYFKIETSVSNILEDMNEKEENKLEKLKQEKSTSSNNYEEKEKEEELKLSMKKIELIQLLVDEPYIVKVLGRFINKNMRSVTIPNNVLKKNTSITSIGKIFDYKVGANSTKVLSIKDEIKDIICEIYFKIKDEL
ncbi:hypothetical protein [Clostridium sp. M14]|uniref:hypothetical protein n=1 Tax=Clostridium sp. M14 TaxID=2716311 RepID=UPI0013EE45CC|nr:hypothetical protein [Clostridium sp. M14]MBZ9691649.1 hypothetical protein [Clostridium sp. M14]NFI58154.1 hypothetical protein [Clostridium botulinum]